MTEVFEAASGGEQRSSLWAKARNIYNVAHGIKDREQFDVLIDFFYEMRGRATGFRFKDWSDYTLLSPTSLSPGNGSQTAFQLVKNYAIAGQAYTRNIYKPVAGTVLSVTVDSVAMVLDVDYTVNSSTGILTFAVPPANGISPVVGAAEFDVPVRFDTDSLDATHEFWETQSWPSIPLKELRAGEI